MTTRQEMRKFWSTEQLKKEADQLKNTDVRTRRNWSALKKETVLQASFELLDRRA